jgi:hypothetical protein
MRLFFYIHVCIHIYIYIYDKGIEERKKMRSLKTQNQIIASEDEIQLLEVEWVYLTRPERLRQLASRYLQDNGYVLASQIKDSSKLEKYYLVSYKKYENSIQSKIDEQLALDDGENVDQVSF